jgi:hypothetical protein
MNASSTGSWTESNQRYLMACIDALRAALEQRVACEEAPSLSESLKASLGVMREVASAMAAPPALDILCEAFGLSQFERNVLLLCVAMELDSRFAQLYAAISGDSTKAHPTFSLALAALPEPHWSALNPEAPLRYWRLIEIGAGNALTTSALRIDERVLHYLAGVQHLDDRLAGFVKSVPAANAIAPSCNALAKQIASAWSQAGSDNPLPILQLCGDDPGSLRAVAARGCELLGLSMSVLQSLSIPVDPRELESLMRLWERESILGAKALLLECGQADASDWAREGAILRLIEGMNCALIISSRERRFTPHRVLITLEVGRSTTDEQRSCWKRELGASAAHLDGRIEPLIEQFNLSVPAIRAACSRSMGCSAVEGKSSNDASYMERALWEACRIQARPRLDNLAKRIESASAWKDLVLPEVQKQILQEIAIHVRRRRKVYEDWGFCAKSSRGLGISTLFAGGSGTGKTMAAEVLANELRLDLYHIDLSQVVNKYIGETEKNLKRVFDAAEDGGAILFFDEADALFGKRSEVKDSHDRYANIEVSYLLQRMESYRGLAILTTNMKEALDPAFLRRIRFVVQFPFPDAAQRADIWRHIFPKNTPTDGLDPIKLAKLSVAGGNIRNIALHGAFLAAEADEPVSMSHLLRAARVEYAKLEKPLTDIEIRGWV